MSRSKFSEGSYHLEMISYKSNTIPCALINKIVILNPFSAETSELFQIVDLLRSKNSNDRLLTIKSSMQGRVEHHATLRFSIYE